MDSRPQPGPAGTVAGLIAGLVISSLLSAALVYSAARAGITPGVSPLVVLFGWVAFGVAMGPRLHRFLAIAQVTGSAGAAVTAGVVFTAPIIQVLHAELGLDVPPVDRGVLILASLSGALLGFGFVGLGTKRFLSDPKLPAPEAVACDRLIRTAVDEPDKRPSLMLSLIPGLLAGFGVNALLSLGRLAEHVKELSLRLTWLPSFGDDQSRDVDVTLPLPCSPLYIGIGALLTLPTALLIFAGGLINAGTTGYAAAHGMPGTTFRWVGGAAMVVAVLYSLLSYVLDGRQGAHAATDDSAAGDDALLVLSPGKRRLLLASIGAGAALLLVMMSETGASTQTLVVMGAVALVLVSLLSGLGGLLSLQVGSSASPVSGTVFVGMLVLSLTALALQLEGISGVLFLVPIVVAACVAICAANDSSQDYKTLQLNGVRVSDGFAGQLLGLLAGAVVVPVTLWLAHDADILGGGTGLGGEGLPAPQASFFATVLNTLFLEGETPWGPVQFGAALGVVAVIMEALGKRKQLILSSLAFAVGIYLPSVIGTGILLGALARFLATFKVSSSTHGGILAAAGLITGDAFASLTLGVLIISEVDMTGIELPAGAEPLSHGVGQALLGVMVLIVLFNYVRRKRDATS